MRVSELRDILHDLAERLRCFLRGVHEYERHFLGGFVCSRCRFASADFQGMGYGLSAYVSPVRRLFTRGPDAIERTTSWDQPRRPLRVVPRAVASADEKERRRA